jgi:hypothetical protein
MRALARSTGLDAHVDFSGTIAQANVSQQVVPLQQDRHYLFCQNLDSVDLWGNFGSAASVGQPGSIRIPVGSELVEEGNFVSGEAFFLNSTKQGHMYTCKVGGGTP